MNNQIYLSKEILNSLENPEIIPFKSGYKGYMVFSKDINEDLDKEKYGNQYKHRYYAYYDLRKNKEEYKKIITFILFNPSTANPDKPIDPTITNCITLAKDNNYNIVEILNIFSHRASTVSTNIKIDNENNIEFIKQIINCDKKTRTFVKAWGFGKENKFKGEINKINKLLNGNEHITKKISVSENAIKKLKESILHPAKSTWSVFGGFNKSAKLTSINDIDKE